MVEEGAFREDLLFRLQVVTVTMPPLRERREDVPALAAHLAAELAERHGRPVEGLTESARRALVAHDWPGNVRELRNALERAIVLSAGGEIDVADLPDRVAGGEAALRPVDAALAGLSFQEARDRARDAFDRSFLSAALERHDGNVSATARDLGMHRQTLQKILRRLDLSP